MRLVLIGSGSFIARHVAQACREAGVEVTALRHEESPAAALRGADAAINFAIHPNFWNQPYETAFDYDLRAAEFAGRAGIPFAMLSTRRVYPEGRRIAAVESDGGGDETAYGRNKALAERGVLAITHGRCVIFRLSNIFGFEYSADGQRKNFFAQLLRNLRQHGDIRFDMSRDTRRDFLPVEACAKALVQGVQQGLEGIYNLGSGFPVSCGEIADWVIDGYGDGRVVVARDEIRDEFFLDMKKWHGIFPPIMTMTRLREACTALGRRLRDA